MHAKSIVEHYICVCIFSSALAIYVAAAASNVIYMYGADGNFALTGGNSQQARTATFPANTCLLTAHSLSSGWPEGILIETSTGVVTDASWKCSTVHQHNWALSSFDDSSWSNAIITGTHEDWERAIPGISVQAKWIWADVTSIVGFTYYAPGFTCKARTHSRETRTKSDTELTLFLQCLS